MTVYCPECWICSHALINAGSFTGCGNRECRPDFPEHRKEKAGSLPAVLPQRVQG